MHTSLQSEIAMDINNYSTDDGSVRIWIEQESSIHMRVITSSGDPVELNGAEAREIAKKLLEYAELIDE